MSQLQMPKIDNKTLDKKDYYISEIEKIEVFIREGLNPQRVIYLITNDGRKLPLTPIGQPMTLSEIEDKAFRITKFLELTLVFNIKYDNQ